jgi:hypothetical protein
MALYNVGDKVVHNGIVYDVIAYHTRIYGLLCLHNDELQITRWVDDDLVYAVKI